MKKLIATALALLLLMICAAPAIALREPVLLPETIYEDLFFSRYDGVRDISTSARIASPTGAAGTWYFVAATTTTPHDNLTSEFKGWKVNQFVNNNTQYQLQAMYRLRQGPDPDYYWINVEGDMIYFNAN